MRPVVLDVISLPQAILRDFPWVPAVATVVVVAVAVIIVARILRNRRR